MAARSTNIRGVDVREGQPIALVEGELVLAGEDLIDDARYALRASECSKGREGAIVTLYAGEGAARRRRGDCRAPALRAFGCEVEVVDGGQPHYPYLIGVE